MITGSDCAGCLIVRATGKDLNPRRMTHEEMRAWREAAQLHFEELDRSGWTSRGQEYNDKEYMALVPGSQWHETNIEQDGAVYDEFWMPSWIATLEDELFEVTGLANDGHPDFGLVYGLTLEAVRDLVADPLLYALATAGPGHTLRAWTRDWMARRTVESC